ncbi:glypican-5-like [Sinocyclocheilus grahami]|uniref:glypican-5-like n=1 Tax=Sinocyclocheilus grahami TaxID=75366 RepID=UPI0007ACB09E|nr:PREDICTED: glypican-5-like [Sinocyclocheilus grahami]
MPRVNVSWIITVLAVELATLSAAHAHSCHEVKTAFQVRQIGQLKWVPETPAIDVDLSICKHAGPSCCTRRMEESYRAAVLRDTTQNIRSYSFELKYLISAHAAAFQGTQMHAWMGDTKKGIAGLKRHWKGDVESQSVDKVCGHSSNASSTTVRTFPLTPVTPPPANSSQDVPGADKIGMLAHLHSSLPLKTSKSDRGRTLKKVAREFTEYISRYKSFFSILPETLCEGEMGVDELTCWSGDDVVKSYTARVVGNGVRAQSQNPEVRVRGADPVLMDVKNKLELFNTEIQEIMPGVGHRESWNETGSGESSGECDDEDGCEGSGESVASPTLTKADVSKKAVTVSFHDSPIIQNTSSSDASLSMASFIIIILALGLHWPFI